MAVTWNVISYNGTKTVGSLSDVITTVHWTATDSETVGSGDSAVTHTGSSYGSIGLAEADAGSFIALASVTKDNLISWAKAAIGADEVTAIETRIAAQITESKTPTVFSGVPS
tara:strand:- start:192 stop:530 length:339 start_codon:yes stop_codon:yes gene_type:complete